MKKIIFSLIFLIIGLSFCFAVMAKQNKSDTFEVDISSHTRVIVSSTTVTTSASLYDVGIERIFFIESSTLELWFQKGGSTDTVSISGMTLKPSTYMIDNTYFGDIYFKGKAGAADTTLSIYYLTKKR